MVMPARKVVDGKLSCRGWDGERHFAPVSDFYNNPKGRKSNMCRHCVSRQNKLKRQERKLLLEQPREHKVVLPTSFEAKVMMMPFVKKC